MYKILKNFAANESGSATVDWVVLTAAIAGVGLIVMLVVTVGIEDMSSDIAVQLDTSNENLDPIGFN